MEKILKIIIIVLSICIVGLSIILIINFLKKNSNPIENNKEIVSKPEIILPSGIITQPTKNPNQEISEQLGYDLIGIQSDGLSKVKKNFKWGYINEQGEEIIPLQFSEAQTFCNGFAKVAMYSKWAIIDVNGNQITPFKYDEIRSENNCVFQEDMAIIRIKENYGFVNKNGQESIKPQYQNILPFKENLAGVKKEGKWGFVDKANQLIIPIDKVKVQSFSEGLAATQIFKEEKDFKFLQWEFLNALGQVVIEPKFDEVFSFNNNLAIVKRQNKWGLINIEGSEIMPLKYDNVYDFKNNMAMVFKLNSSGQKKYGFINHNGQEMIPLKYEYANDFNEGFAVVRNNHKYGFVDVNGKEVTPIHYNEAKSFKNGFAEIKLDEKEGFLGLDLKEYWNTLSKQNN
jgi:hypothetical protein